MSAVNKRSADEAELADPDKRIGTRKTAKGKTRARVNDNDNLADSEKSDDDEFSEEEGEEENEEEEGEEEEEDEDDSDHMFGDYDEKTMPESEELLQIHDETVIFRIFPGEDTEEFEPWMDTFILTCHTYVASEVRSLDEESQIGVVTGRYINRAQIRDQFWRHMEEPSAYLSSIAFSIFDRYGRLVSHLKEHIVKKGSGAWGNELDTGPLFIIEKLRVDKIWKEKGLGTMMLNYVLQKSKEEERAPSFTLMEVGWDDQSDFDSLTKSERHKAVCKQMDEEAKFYRANGFRRIGDSDCFGLATDKNHPSHSISEVDDFDPEFPIFDAEYFESKSKNRLDDSEQIIADVSLILQKRWPLLHALKILSDKECLKFLNDFKATIQASVGLVEGANEVIPEWKHLDYNRNTVLHLAGIKRKYQSLKWLLANLKIDNLRNVRNMRGHTPLESFKHVLEEGRTIKERGFLTVCVSDNFEGFSSEEMECIMALQEPRVLSPLELLRMKYGCTCNQCIDGFISPRMQDELASHAEMRHDYMMDMFVDDAKYWMEAHEDDLIYLPPKVRQNFLTNKSLRQGFAMLFHYIAQTLRAGRRPSAENIMESREKEGEWPPVTMNYLNRGGTVEAVLRILFEIARDEDVFGPLLFDEEPPINILPECRNDMEYGFVARMCGVPLQSMYELN